MHRIDAFLAVLADPSAPPVVGDEPIDTTLLTLLAHVAFADGQVGDEEFTLLARLFPGLGSGAILERVTQALDAGLDVDALKAALPTPVDRSKALRFATHMAWADDDLHPGEGELIRRLARELGVAHER